MSESLMQSVAIGPRILPNRSAPNKAVSDPRVPSRALAFPSQAPLTTLWSQDEAGEEGGGGTRAEGQVHYHVTSLGSLGGFSTGMGR